MPATSTDALRAREWLRRPGAAPGAGPRRLHGIVVPVDGSPFAERALPVAAWAACALGAPLHLVEMVGTGDAPESAIHHLDDLAHRHGAASWAVARGDHPGAAIVAATRHDRDLACLATHGRDRSAAVLGSVAKAVLDRTADPVMLVGPKARPPCAGDAPVVVAADGGPGDPAVVAVGVEWAARLERPLVVATVAEPVRATFRDSLPRRRHAGGPEGAEAYVARLANDASGWGTPVEARVVYDPINVRTGVLRLVGRTTALLVLGTHRRTRPLRALVGSHAARIVHDVEVPALVVPLDPPGRSEPDDRTGELEAGVVGARRRRVRSEAGELPARFNGLCTAGSRTTTGS